MVRSVVTEKNNFNEIDGNNVSVLGDRKKAIDFIVKNQLKDNNLWREFVDVFRRRVDCDDGGWRGEYWGKMMRGACMAFECTHDYELYRTITNSVYDMIDAQDPMGRISTYSPTSEFFGWDIWCRKYVMLGMEYYIDICKEERFIKIIIECIKRQADYIIGKVGAEEGKIRILDTSDWWGGLNSSSILEPIVRLYKLTGEEKYKNFADYIISCGFCKQVNLIDNFYEKKLFPYQLPYTKAYEMMSCFEGLIEYYKIFGTEKYLTAAINFADMVIESDVSIIGCCGCTHELFDHSAIKQTEPANEFIMQETCVTVTWMKFCFNLLKLTGNVKYADCIEKSGYNALLGSINFNLNDFKYCENQTENLNHGIKMPFDSYSPLYYDRRGKKFGGFKNYRDDYYYGCCACIGSAGIAVFNKFGALQADNGIVINDLKRSTVSCSGLSISISGDINLTGKSKILIKRATDTCQSIILRIPQWLENSQYSINGCDKIDCVRAENGYLELKRIWLSGDVIEIIGKVRVREHVINNKLSFTYGYVVLARDEEVDDQFRVPISDKIKLKAWKSDKFSYGFKADNNGTEIKFIEYSGAGQHYDDGEKEITVWSDIQKA